MTLNDELRAFLQSGLAIEVAGRDERNTPVIARALACRVSDDGQRVTLFVPRVFGAACLDNFATRRDIAAVFGHPPTHRSVQLKGSDAALVAVSDEDRRLVDEAVDIFATSLASSRPPSAVEGARVGLRGVAADLEAVTFSVDAAFVQTPGPAAGTRI